MSFDPSPSTMTPTLDLSLRCEIQLQPITLMMTPTLDPSRQRELRHHVQLQLPSGENDIFFSKIMEVVLIFS